MQYFRAAFYTIQQFVRFLNFYCTAVLIRQQASSPYEICPAIILKLRKKNHQTLMLKVDIQFPDVFISH